MRWRYWAGSALSQSFKKPSWFIRFIQTTVDRFEVRPLIRALACFFLVRVGFLVWALLLNGIYLLYKDSRGVAHAKSPCF